MEATFSDILQNAELKLTEPLDTYGPISTRVLSKISDTKDGMGKGVLKRPPSCCLQTTGVGDTDLTMAQRSSFGSFS